MAERRRHAPADSQEALSLPPLDYAEGLAIARQFVHWFRGAEALATLVEHLAQYEQYCVEIQTRIQQAQRAEYEAHVALTTVQQQIAEQVALRAAAEQAAQEAQAQRQVEVQHLEEQILQWQTRLAEAEAEWKAAETARIEQSAASQAEAEAATVAALAHRQQELDGLFAAHQAQVMALEERARLAEIATTTFEQRLAVLRQQAAVQLGLAPSSPEETR